MVLTQLLFADNECVCLLVIVGAGSKFGVKLELLPRLFHVLVCFSHKVDRALYNKPRVCLEGSTHGVGLEGPQEGVRI